MADLCYAMDNRYLREGKIMTNSGSRRWMPTAGGVLNIVSGGIGLLNSLVVCAVVIVSRIDLSFFDFKGEFGLLVAIFAIYFAYGAVTFILGIISIVGGVYSLKRRHWGWALAGSICSAFPFTITGVPALVFIIMGKKEFSGQKPIHSSSQHQF